MSEKKPPLGVIRYDYVATCRINELAEAIQRQCECNAPDIKLVDKWAREITWQCSMIEALKGA